MYNRMIATSEGEGGHVVDRKRGAGESQAHGTELVSLARLCLTSRSLSLGHVISVSSDSDTRGERPCRRGRSRPLVETGLCLVGMLRGD